MGSKWSCRHKTDFIFGLKMQLQECQISFTGSTCSCRYTIFQLWAPNAVADIPDFIYRLHMHWLTYCISFMGSKCSWWNTWFHWWAQHAAADIQISLMGSKWSCRHKTDFIFGLKMQLQECQISFTGSTCGLRHTRFQLRAPNVQTYHFSFMDSKCSWWNTRFHFWAPHAVADIPDFIYGLQMQLRTYHTLFMGSKRSWKNTRFQLWAPYAAADIPDIN